MGRVAYTDEICPECGAVFRAPAKYVSGHSPVKVCPNGHATSIRALLKMRKSPEKPKAKTRAIDPLEAHQLAVRALIDGIEQALRSLPNGSVVQNIVAGATRGAVEMARKVTTT